MSGAYDDIIHLAHPVSRNHPQQPMEKRAAQFSPFAALTGFDDAVEETARYTDSRQELTEEQTAKINSVLNRIQRTVSQSPAVSVEFFSPDPKKQGGFYRLLRSRVRKIRPYEKQLVLSDGTVIPFSDILSIDILPSGATSDPLPDQKP